MFKVLSGVSCKCWLGHCSPLKRFSLLTFHVLQVSNFHQYSIRQVTDNPGREINGLGCFSSRNWHSVAGRWERHSYVNEWEIESDRVLYLSQVTTHCEWNPYCHIARFIYLPKVFFCYQWKIPRVMIFICTWPNSCPLFLITFQSM